MPSRSLPTSAETARPSDSDAGTAGARSSAAEAEASRWNTGAAYRAGWRSALRTALIVGVVLTAINQSGAIRDGVTPATLARIAMNFAVPFVVATYSRLALIREISCAAHPSSSAPEP